MKENFPSKIQLTQENIEMCAPEYIPMSQSEEIRRQLSCILSIKEENRSLTLDECEDVVCTMDFAEKIRDFRSLSACLEIFNTDRVSDLELSQCLEGYTLLLVRIMESKDPRQLTSNRQIANLLH